MAFTEIKLRGENKYYYQTFSIREGEKISKKRFYLGKNLSKTELEKKLDEANKKIYQIKRERKGDFQKIERKTRKFLKDKGIKKAGIFGSYSRGDQRKNSDVDILMEVPEKYKGLEFFRLQEKLSKKIGKKVDILTYKGINPLIKEKILKEEVRILWKKMIQFF